MNNNPTLPATKPLTLRQQRFCDEYLVDGNAARAARAAGYAASTAVAHPERLLNHAAVKAYIAEQRTQLAAQLHLDAQQVLQHLAQIAFFDVRKLYNADNTLVPVTELDAATAAAIACIEVVDKYSGAGAARTHAGNTTKVKLHSKVAALLGLAKHLGLFDKDNSQHNNDVNVVVMIGDEVISG